MYVNVTKIVKVIRSYPLCNSCIAPAKQPNMKSICNEPTL